MGVYEGARGYEARDNLHVHQFRLNFSAIRCNLLSYRYLIEEYLHSAMKIQTIIGLLCFAAVSSLLLKASGVVKPMWKARKDVLSTEDFLELSDKICESDESTGEDTLDCIIDLHAANKRHGYTSDFFYARLSHWTGEIFVSRLFSTIIF